MTLGCEVEDTANLTYSMDLTSAASNFDIGFREVTEPTTRTVCVVSRRHGRLDLMVICYKNGSNCKRGDQLICVFPFHRCEKAKTVK